MTIKELREKRAKAWDDARDFLDSKRNDSGLLSEEDSKTYDAMEQQIVAYGKEIERLERQEKLAREMNAATSVPLVSAPGTHTEQTEKTGIASDSYSKAFWNNIRNRNFIDVRNDLQIGTDSEGGYLCPDEFEKKLISSLEEENVFRPLATKIQTSSGDRKIPVITQKGEACWMEEEEAFLIGDGKGKPTGIFAATGGAENGATSAGAAITFDDMMELFYSLKSPYRKKAVWLLNEQTLKALRKVKDSNGQYIWSPSVQAGIPDTILNRPYVTSVYAPTPDAGNKAIAFGDFSYYWIADRQGRSLKRLNELFAMNGQIGFLASQRVDGKLILPEAVKTLTIKGTSTAKA